MSRIARIAFARVVLASGREMSEDRHRVALAFQTFLIAMSSRECWYPSSGPRGDTIWASSGCRSSMSSSMSSTSVNGLSERGVLGELDEAPPKLRQAFS